MKKNTTNKTVVVTGGTKGLGRAMAEKFASNGFDVCVCARTQSDLDSMRSEWELQFPNARLITHKVDLSQRTEVLHFADLVRKNWPKLDVLINNAGLFMPGAISEEPTGAFETMMEVNMYSAYYLTRALLPMMIEQKDGHIFNICSVASITAYPNGGSYSISKFALLGFSKVLREEMKTKGIKVSAILPGATWSDSWRGVDLPQERLMQAEDIAKAVWAAYNLSDSAVVEELVIRPQLGDL